MGDLQHVSWTSARLDIDNTETLQQACDGGALKASEPRLRVQSVKCFNTGADQSTGSATGGPAFCPTADDLYDAWGTAGLIDPANNTDPGTDPQLGGVAAGSPGGITGTFPTSVDDRYFPAGGTLTAAACGLEPGFFDAAPYIGAFVPGGSTGGGRTGSSRPVAGSTSASTDDQSSGGPSAHPTSSGRPMKTIGLAALFIGIAMLTGRGDVL
jgi:hypothetical protein